MANPISGAAGKDVSLEIIGIFSGTEGLATNPILVFQNPSNVCFVDYATADWSTDDIKFNSLNIYLNSADTADETLETIKNLPELKDKTFLYEINREAFDLIATPLNSLQSMMMTRKKC